MQNKLKRFTIFYTCRIKIPKSNNFTNFILIRGFKIKYFIYEPVSVTKKLRPLQSKVKYQCGHNNVSYL